MGIDSNINGVNHVDSGSNNSDFSSSSSIKTGVNQSIGDVLQDFFDHIHEHIQESIDQLQLKPDESVNDYLDPSTMTEEDWKKYQDRLDEIIRNSSSPKEAIANIARFMAYEFPKLHYFWGGGHGLSEEQFYGLMREWGSSATIEYDGSAWIEGEQYPFSLDCGGFVTWVLLNAGINLADYYPGYDPYDDPCLNTTEISTMGEHYSFDAENLLDTIEPGDIAWSSGHVGIVMEVDKENNTITVVHISGSGQGTNVTTFEIPSGRIVADDLGELPEFEDGSERSTDGSSPRQNTDERKENEYYPLFTEFIHLN